MIPMEQWRGGGGLRGHGRGTTGTCCCCLDSIYTHSGKMTSVRFLGAVNRRNLPTINTARAEHFGYEFQTSVCQVCGVEHWKALVRACRQRFIAISLVLFSISLVAILVTLGFTKPAQHNIIMDLVHPTKADPCLSEALSTMLKQHSSGWWWLQRTIRDLWRIQARSQRHELPG